MKTWIAALLAASSALALAHDPGLSTATLRVEDEQIVVELSFAPEDLALLDSAAGDTATAKYDSLANRALSWTPTSGATIPVTASVEVQPRDILFRYVLPKASAEFHSRLVAELPFGHRQWFTERDLNGAILRSEMLSAKSPPLRVSVEQFTSPSGRSPMAIGSFFWLGIEHIVTGYDHLFFLVSLLIVCPRLGSATQIVTFFTIAHSLTMAAAAIGWLRVPSAVVEPVIAATIVYVALENLFTQRSIRWRCCITFVFGLVHGLGFASVLQDLGAAKGQILIPVLGFNLGVECGQLGLAAVAFPLWLRWRQSPRYSPRVVPAVSITIASVGLLWLFQRTVFAAD
jgi:hydrogenase/urease accessory protein HupE